MYEYKDPEYPSGINEEEETKIHYLIKELNKILDEVKVLKIKKINENYRGRVISPIQTAIKILGYILEDEQSVKLKESNIEVNEEVRNVKARDLAKLLQNTITAMENFRNKLFKTKETLITTDGNMSGDIDVLLNTESKIIDIHNEFDKALKNLKGE